jgi:7,8-dihydropterin-6-yl-methyl-4-(beta-D-ribofuranosyl)aminobenzene 5'-phosphate synthase
MTLRLTTLSENSVARGNFLGEWGLSVLVETETGNILLDTGRSVSTTYNADTLGIDLRRIDKIVLSHAHYDHTGGLVSVLRRMKKEVEVIAHPDVWAAKYVQRPDQEPRYIGIPFQRAELDEVLIVVVSEAEMPTPTERAVLDSAFFLMDGFGIPHEYQCRNTKQQKGFLS